MFVKRLPVNEEFFICRHANGVQLVKPRKNEATFRHKTYPLSSLFQLPFSIYFLDANSDIRGANEACLLANRFESETEICGKSIFDLYTRQSAEVIRRNDLYVMTHHKINIIEEEASFSDEIHFDNLTFDFPWFDSNYKIMGTFGLSIVLGKQPLAEALSKILEIGLLNTQNAAFDIQSYLSKKNLDGYYLSKRQVEVLQFVIRGKTAKEIAIIMGLSKRTIEQYIEAIKQKFHATTKSELIDKAIYYFNY